MSPIEYDLGSRCSCIDVSMELLRRIWWTVVHSQQKSLAVNICGLPLSGSWSYCSIDWTVSVVGAFLLEFAARQSSWPRTESWHFQTSAEDIHFCEILMTKCIKRIRDVFEYALYKFTLYLLTYLLTLDGWRLSEPCCWLYTQMSNNHLIATQLGAENDLPIIKSDYHYITKRSI